MYFSATSAKFSFVSISFPGVTDLVGAITSRQLDLDLYFKIEGNGFVSIPVKSLQGQVYLEDVYIGNIKSTEPLQIPASGTTTAHVLVHLDFSAISAADIQDVVTSVTSHNYEVKFGFNGYVEPVIMFFPITIPLQHDMFMLTLSDAPQVSAISWDSPSVNVGEPVGFHVTVRNVFRGSSVDGVLDLAVREDIASSSDVDAKIYHFTVQLSPGESRTYSDTFTPYKKRSTRGFFLKTQWGTKTLAEQESAYPPRLQVLEGTLTLANVYWKVNGVTTTTCNIGDQVEAHVVVSAIGGPVEDSIKSKIRKDISTGLDTDLKAVDFNVSLATGQSAEYAVTFTPDKPSGGSLRGYFVEIEGDLSWTMPSNYPPRLHVVGGSLGLVNVYWTVSGAPVSSCIVGDTVIGHVNVIANGGPVEGAVTVKIRKDIAAGLDTDFKVLTFDVSLATSQTAEYVVAFAPDTPTGGSLRGYFVEIEGSLSWTMPSSYPPRLTVTQTEGTPSITNFWWTINDQIVTVAQQGQTVVAHVLIKAEGGALDGDVTVHVRKDLALSPDEDYVVQSFSLSLSKDETVEFTITFTASDKSGLTFRGYFIQVDLQPWDNTWTMGSSYPPRLKVN
jgi:LEA14-like dessication related protein